MSGLNIDPGCRVKFGGELDQRVIRPKVSYLIYGAPTTGKSTFVRRALRKGLSCVDTDKVIADIVGADKVNGFMKSASPEARETLFSLVGKCHADILVTNLTEFLPIADASFTCSKERIVALMKKRSSALGDVFNESDYEWLTLWDPYKYMIKILRDDEFISDNITFNF